MRGYLLRLVAAGLAAALCSCGAEEGGAEGPGCGGGFAEKPHGRSDGAPAGGCLQMYHFSGVVVKLPYLHPDSRWTLHGVADDEPFTCTYVPGMVLDRDPCSDNPRIRWTYAGVDLLAHPCHLEVHLVVEGVEIAWARVRPRYEWTEPNGEGCGWVGKALVDLLPAD